MKKVKSGLTWLLIALTVLYPAGRLIASCFGYTFKLVSISAFAIAIAVLSIGVVFVLKKSFEIRAIQVPLAIITPFSLINAVLYIFDNPKIWVIVSAFFSVGCCFYLTIKYGKPIVLKSIALVLSTMMVLPIGFISFIFLTFGNIGQNTVVQTIESPNGEYYAQVIDSDQGALGGDTLVDVYQKSGINAFLFKIEKKPQRVYWGDWGEFENMQIYWKDDNRLVINSVEYEIK